METGNNSSISFDQTFPSIKDYYAFFHLRYDGASVVITDYSRKKILGLRRTDWLASKDDLILQQKLEEFLASLEIDLSSAAGIEHLLSFSNFCLIPDVYYEQGKGKALLEQTCRLEDDHQLFSDFWTQRDVVLVYALKKSLYQYLNSWHSSVKIAHNAYGLNKLMQKYHGKDERCFMQVSPSFAEIILIKNQKLVFYNQLPYDEEADLLYYLLFVFEQNRTPPPEVHLELSYAGGVSHSLNNTLRKYIGQVEDYKLQEGNHGHEFAQKDLRGVCNLLSLL